LAATEKARAACEGVAPPGEWIARGGPTDARANLSADIKAGPGIDRRGRGGDRRHGRPRKRQIGGGRRSEAESDTGGNNKTAGERPHRRATPHLSGRTPDEVSSTAPAHANRKKPKLFGQSVVSRWRENDFELLA